MRVGEEPRTTEPDWEGKGEPQGERGRVGRLLGIRRDESIVEAARRVRRQALDGRRRLCLTCGDERPLAPCPTCSFDEGASDDVGPGERLLLREVLGAEEGESLVAAAQRVAGERVDAMSEAQAWRDARRLLRLIGLSRGEPLKASRGGGA